MFPTSIPQNNPEKPSELYPNSYRFQSDLVLSHFSQYLELVIKQFNQLSIRDDDDVNTSSRNQGGSTISRSQHAASIKLTNILNRSKDDYKTNPMSQFEFEQVIQANEKFVNIKRTIVLDGRFDDEQHPLDTGQYIIIRPKVNGQRVDHCSLLNIRINNTGEYFDPLGIPPPEWIKECCHNNVCVQNPYHNTCAIHCLCIMWFWNQGLTLSEIIEQYRAQTPDLFTVYYDDLVIEFYTREIRSNLYEAWTNLLT